jgi:hypothetical protein
MFRGPSFFVLWIYPGRSKARPTGRVPSDAILFSTPKKYAKRLISCGGHFFRQWSVFCSTAMFMNKFVLRGTENQALLF